MHISRERPGDSGLANWPIGRRRLAPAGATGQARRPGQVPVRVGQVRDQLFKVGASYAHSSGDLCIIIIRIIRNNIYIYTPVAREWKLQTKWEELAGT